MSQDVVTPPPRGTAAICIPVRGAYDLFAQCLASVVEHTPPGVLVTVADDASTEPAIAELVERVNAARADRRPLRYVRRAENVGFVHNVNIAMDELAPADLIVLNSDCVVAAGWFERMHRAAYSDTRVATVSVLSNNGTIVSVPGRNQPLDTLPQDWSLDQSAWALQQGSPRLYPTLPAAIGHCMYLRRSAIDLVGKFDEAFAPGYEEEVDFSQRCIRHGLAHVLADDVIVLHYGRGSFGRTESTQVFKDDHHELVMARYPYWDEWVDEVQHSEDSPLARSLAAGRRAFMGTTVTVDGRILTRFMTGTQLHVLELVAALHDTGELTIRVIMPEEPGAYATDVLGGLERVVLIGEEEVDAGPPSDVVHRPYQVSSLSDLKLLLDAGERLVITQQDLISLHNPSYHAGYEAWREYRDLTRTALAAADRVAFFSRHARGDAVREELVQPGRAKVALLGTDHRLSAQRPGAASPRGGEHLDGRRFLLCIGTDFVHKNRVFAIRLLDALRADHGWDGQLVFAGPHVDIGSSAGEEAAELAARPELHDQVIDLAAVDEAGKRWLLERATAVVYPTAYEGFGLVPFEAAEYGIPCLFAPEAALGELLPETAALLVPWDASASAERCITVLLASKERDRHVHMLQATAASLNWGKTASDLLRIYREAISEPPRDTRRLVSELAALRAQPASTGRLDVYSNALVGPGGTIPEDMRRPMLAITARRLPRTLLFTPIRAAYRLARLARGRR